VLRKDGDVGGRGESGEMLAGLFGVIRKWSEVLQRRTMWHGCTDRGLCWWCVRLWVEIWMVHRSMRNGSKVMDELYIKRGLSVLEDFLFFSLNWFSCIAKQVTTLK
jgi:hypothetical protein